MKYQINYKGFIFEFDMNYEPYEAQTYEYPGSPAAFEIYNVTLNGIDADELLEHQREEFEEAAIEYIKNY